MRTIRLSHEEIETIKAALQSVYENQIDIVSKNRGTLTKEAAESILSSAKKIH